MIFRELNIESNDNSLFVTAQCNNRCLMCSQPPLKRNDIDFLFEKNLYIVKSAPKELTNIGITGGEPALLGEKLFLLIEEIKSHLPNTLIHILSNGRIFSNKFYTKQLSQTNANLLMGIPLHSDYIHDHDCIAQSPNAYNETLLGLYNLAEFGLNIELRIVINKLNYKRLAHLSDFIYKNLPFVKYISFMSMEVTGYAIKNWGEIGIEPEHYALQLEEAVLNLTTWGMNVSIFNLPLCCLPENLHEFARKSISDWKVKFLPECENCMAKKDCCGLFATSKNTLRIKPFLS
jgi:His-Xaa-Ser system radical SAM maturase HxsC